MTWREAIQDEGFAVVPAFFSVESIDRLLEDIDRLSPQRSRAGVRHAFSLPPVAGISHDPRLLELACEVLGENAFPFHATIFEKSPTANWLVVWHQDTALPLRERVEQLGWGPWSVKEGVNYAHAPAAALSQVLALRIHLDDSTSDNGPLKVVPCTHTLGVLTDDRIHELAMRNAPVACVAGKGGVVAIRPLAIHASSKSQTEMPRRVLHIEYAASESIVSPLRLAVA